MLHKFHVLMPKNAIQNFSITYQNVIKSTAIEQETHEFLAGLFWFSK